MSQFFSRLFGGGKKDRPPAAAPPIPKREDATAIAKREALERRKRLTKTILTGPRGLEEEAPGTRKTLLGE